MRSTDRLAPSDLPPYLTKDRLRILTVCNYGQVRSVAMMHAFHRRGFPNAYATGAVAQWPVTLDRHFSNADIIIVCNKPNLEERYEREKHPDKLGVVRVHELHADRIIICDTIGLDRWGDPMKEPLVKICEEFLADIR